jgi:hypothetical protein
VATETLPRASLFQYGLYCVLGSGCFEKWKTVKATERNEVKSLRFLEPLQAVWHGPIVIGLRLCSKTRSSR